MKSKILNVLSILFALMFINSGINKFTQHMPIPEDLPESLLQAMQSLMEVSWLMPLVGTVEVIAAVLIIVKKYRPLGAIMIFPIMIGIFLTHALTDINGLPVAIILLAINLWIIADNWNKYKPMIE